MVSVLLVVVWIGSGWCNSGDLKLWSRTTLPVESWVSIVHGSIAAGSWRYAPFAFHLVVPFDQPPCEPWSLTLSSSWSRNASGWHMVVPLWPVVACAAACTLGAWWKDSRALARKRACLCPNCNYDRTGLAVGAVCPECGDAEVAAVVAK